MVVSGEVMRVKEGESETGEVDCGWRARRGVCAPRALVCVLYNCPTSAFLSNGGDFASWHYCFIAAGFRFPVCVYGVCVRENYTM